MTQTDRFSFFTGIFRIRGVFGKVLALTLIISFGLCHNADAGSRRGKRNFDSKRYGNKRIIVRQRKPSIKDLQGELPSKEEIRPAVERFFSALDKLPENFVKRSGIKYVTILKNPRFKGISIGGLASGNCIVLSLHASEETVFHEFFHIFDPQRKQKKWTKLNARRFVYTGSVYYESTVSGSKKRRSKRDAAAGTYNHDFVSRYAMSNEQEDRAETFAAMMSEGKNFLRRTEKSEVMRNKMEYIIELTGKRRLMGKDFWSKHFGQDRGRGNHSRQPGSRFAR